MSPHEARQHLIRAVIGLEDELVTLPIAAAEHPLASEPDIAIRLSIGNQAFTLAHSMAPDLCDTAYLETHFGQVPVDQRSDAYRQLLELNFSWMSVQARGFGIDKASNDVILTVALPITQLSAAHLAACMDAYRGLAMVWQERCGFHIHSSIGPRVNAQQAAPAFGANA